MKKIVAILTALLICCALFAVEQGFTFSLSPYALQMFAQYSESTEKLHSTYGFGTKLGYEVKPFKSFDMFVGGDAEFLLYKVKDREKMFFDWTMLAKAKYEIELSKVFELNPIMYFGMELQSYDKTTSAVMTFGSAIETKFNLSDNWALVGQIEGLFGFPKKEETHFGNFKINSFIGAEYTL